jgi:hypothetical protein
VGLLFLLWHGAQLGSAAFRRPCSSSSSPLISLIFSILGLRISLKILGLL